MPMQDSKPMDAINAPYNFVPLSEQVISPKWAPLVSQDLPFRLGLSGEIHYHLTAQTPLLVGGLQTKRRDDSTDVEPFRLPTGDPAIPGTSLKGMIRSVLEIATFSRMSQVDDKRYGLRDISGSHVAASYGDRVRNRLHYGLMRLGQSGEPEITPCEMARLNHRELESWWKAPPPAFKKRSNVMEKYGVWQTLCKRQKIADPFRVPIDVSGDAIVGLGKGGLTGFPVLTGQINDSLYERRDRSGKLTRGKHHDFFFHSPRPAETFSVADADPAAWRDFLFIHGDEDGKKDMSWPSYWKRRFWEHKQVPVFYILNGNRLQIGLAFMPKLAGDYSIHDMIGHSGPEHLDDTLADFATLIFGRVDENGDQSLSGRVQFEPAMLVGKAEIEEQPPAILSSPKPTYFPSYIEQDVTGPAWKLKDKDAQYATYLDTGSQKKPRLRGWKRYPVHAENEVKVQRPLGPDQEKNPKIQLHLKPLKAGCRFFGVVHFHNLLPEELGALLWSMQLGGNGALHRMGMGKSFGFGQITLGIDPDNTRLVPNDPDCEAFPFKDCIQQFQAYCIQQFQAYMNDELECDWEQTPQIRNLTAMAKPEDRKLFKAKLEYMVLARLPDPEDPRHKINRNDFTEAKQLGLVLAPYANPSTTASKRQVPTSTTWNDAKLEYNPGSRTLNAYRDNQVAFVAGDETKPLLDAMSGAKLKKLKKGNLKARVHVQHIGGKNWKIIKLE